MTAPWLIIGQVLLDSAIQYVSSRNALLAGVTIEGRVLDWGRVSKTISPFAAGPQTSDAVFRIVDTDQKWRDLSLTQALRGRTVRLRFAIADDDWVSADPFWVGEIQAVSFGPGWIQISARDNSWSWMDEFVPPLLTVENFPYLISSSDGAFAKIIFGDVNDSVVDGAPVGSDKYGAVELNHVGLVGGVDRYCVARHTIYDIAVYRKASGDPVFSPVDPSEYNVTVENLIVDGYTYEMTFIDFLTDQLNATITANVKGLYFRPAVTGYAAEGYDPILNPTGVPGELHNPIDAFLNFMRLDCRKALSFDYDSIMAIRSTFEAVDLINGGTAAYDCSGVVDTSETRRSTLTKFLPCFLLDMFHNRAGEITLNFTQENVEDKPLYSDQSIDGDRNLILRESFSEVDPNPIANRCVIPALRHYAAGVWLWNGGFENFADQAVASVPERDASDEIVVGVRDPRIDSITTEFWFCRDTATIYDVIARRMAFMALRSYQQQYDLPTPEVIDEVELCRLVRLTHRLGLAAGGYSRVETKIFGINFDLKGFTTTLNTVRRVPETVISTDTVYYGTVTILGESEMSLIPSEYTLIDSTSAASGDTHSATTPEIDSTGADLLIAAVGDKGFSDGSLVTDNYGNTWTKSPPTLYSNLSSTEEQVQLWYCKPAAVGPLHAFTVTEVNPSFPSFPSIAVVAFVNSSVSPFDVENGFYLISSGTTIQPGSITPSEDRELVVTAVASDGAISSPSIGSGFTIVENQPQIPTAYGIALAYKVQPTAAAVNPTWNSGGPSIDMTASIASFKAA